MDSYGMLAVGLSESDIRPYIEKLDSQLTLNEIEIGCINSPVSVTLTGSAPQLDSLKKTLDENSIFACRLNVKAAYHSKFMNSFASDYEDMIGQLDAGTKTSAAPVMYSSVTGSIVCAEELRSAKYWSRNLISPVLFAPALGKLMELGARRQKENSIYSEFALLEIGPRGALRTPIREILTFSSKGSEISYVPALDIAKPANSAFLEAVGHLYCLGYPVDLSAVNLLHSRNFQCLTDIPEYPFDHSRTYWHESRLSRNHRFRKYARNDLLGSREFNWNPLQPRWRNIIKLLENPWIEDHQIGGSLIYPGAGMLVMAIEAAAQYTKDIDVRKIVGFTLKDVAFVASLNISLSPEGTETEIYLKPIVETIDKYAVPAWFEFRICLLEENKWSETCRGMISVELDRGGNDDSTLTHARNETNIKRKRYLHDFKERVKLCTTSLSNHKLYQGFKSFGLDFGLTFQVFEAVRHNDKGGTAAADIKLKAWTLRSDPSYSTAHFVHPTALDGVLQLPVVALGAGVTKQVPTMVPTRIAKMWVSAQGLGSDALGAKVAAVAVSEYQGFRSTKSEVLVIDPECEELKVVVEGLETMIIKDDSMEEHEKTKSLCYRIEWKPDIDMMTSVALQNYCQGRNSAVAQPSPNNETYFAQTGIHCLRRYVDLLMHKHHDLKILEIAPCGAADVSRLILWPFLHATRAQRNFWVESFAQYDVGVEENVNSQDWSITLEREGNDSRVGIFPFDPPGSELIETTRRQSNDREEQIYDLVLVAVQNHEISATVQRLWKVAKAGCRFIIVTPSYTPLSSDDPSFTDILSNIRMFDLRPSFSTMELFISQVVDNSITMPSGPQSIVALATANFQPTKTMGPQSLTIVIISKCSTIHHAFAEKLQKCLFNIGCPDVKVAVWDETLGLCIPVPEKEDLHFICLYDVGLTSVSKAGQDIFAIFKYLVSISKSIFWISTTVQGEITLEGTKLSQVVSGTEAGLIRTLAAEYPYQKFTTLSLELSHKSQVATASTHLWGIQLISQVIEHTYYPSSGSHELEYRFRQVDDIAAIEIPRLRRYHEIDEHVSSYLHPSKTISSLFKSATYPNMTLTITSPGLLDTLRFIPNPPPPNVLSPHAVIIQPFYAGLNFLDLLTALGRVPQISVLGVEASGTVLAAGKESDLQPGDRVAVLTNGTLRSKIQAHYLTAIKIPDKLSFRDAASIPGAACTVYRALVDVARLRPGERILIHAGAGATGQMAIQLAKHLGAEIFVTVGSEKKKRLIIDAYGIDEERIFYSRDTSFASAVKRMTNGEGVDVILNSLAGNLLETGWEEVVASFGRWIELGKRDILEGGRLGMRTFLKNVTFSCVDLSGIWGEKPAMMRNLLTNVFDLVKRGHLNVVEPLREFGIGNVESAFRSLQNGQDGGKVIIDMNGQEEIKLLIEQKPTWSLRGDRSYVIVGGLGGLGRFVARWMVKRGAKHLVLISRDSVGNDAVKIKLVKDLEDANCNVYTPKCDIADENALRNLLLCHSRLMPPIAGCIQAGMVLKDISFVDMSFEDWTSSTRPKICGSWNLHTLLSKQMDFFVLLSSIVGVIGGTGQANYAAGNTFQDALARHRVTIGEKAVSLDLGMMVGEGVVAEDERLARALESSGWYQPMTTQELECLLERYCDPDLAILAPDEAQVVCGIEIPANIRARGHKVPAWMEHSMFRHLHMLEGNATNPSNDRQTSFKTLFHSAASLNDAGALVTKALVTKLSNSLGIPPVDIDTSRPLHSYGVDSLVAVELRNWFTKELGADVAIFSILSNSSCNAIGLLAAEKSVYKLGAWSASD